MIANLFFDKFHYIWVEACHFSLFEKLENILWQVIQCLVSNRKGLEAFKNPANPLKQIQNHIYLSKDW